MATSDNVVRAGLTPKFKDVSTLCGMLTHIDGLPRFVTPAPLGPNHAVRDAGRRVHRRPRRLRVGERASSPSLGVSVLLILDGGAQLGGCGDRRAGSAASSLLHTVGRGVTAACADTLITFSPTSARRRWPSARRRSRRPRADGGERGQRGAYVGLGGESGCFVVRRAAKQGSTPERTRSLGAPAVAASLRSSRTRPAAARHRGAVRHRRRGGGHRRAVPGGATVYRRQRRKEERARATGGHRPIEINFPPAEAVR